MNDGDHYLIEKVNSKPYELTNGLDTIVINNMTYGKRTHKYIGLLEASFADCWDIQPALNDAKLEHKSLIDLTVKYHNYVCKDQKCIIYQKVVPRFRLKYAPLASLSISRLGFRDNELYLPLNFNNTYYLSVGFLLDVSHARINEKFSLQISSKIGKSHFSGY